MSDAHDRERPEGEREETETELETELESDVEETEVEGDPDEGEAELSEGDRDGEREPDTRTQRESRGQPDDRQRDRRRTREEEFQREVDRAVERRLAERQPNRTVDFEAQRREHEQRRKAELDEARLSGPEAYADVRDRHLREDYRLADQVREMRHADDRDMQRFERLCDRNKIYDGIRDEVDAEVGRLRANGSAVVNREAVANFLLGKRYADRAARQGSQQRKRADSETRRQTVRSPSSTAGQHAEPRRRGSARSFAELSVDEMERQLAGVPVRST